MFLGVISVRWSKTEYGLHGRKEDEKRTVHSPRVTFCLCCVSLLFALGVDSDGVLEVIDSQRKLCFLEPSHSVIASVLTCYVKKIIRHISSAK